MQQEDHSVQDPLIQEEDGTQEVTAMGPEEVMVRQMPETVQVIKVALVQIPTHLLALHAVRHQD